jgi:hypothetical protein
MRKTTIFRFSSCSIVLAVLALPASTAAQQDTLAVQQEGESQVHVVQEGETLWLLAGRYLGDPLLWPEIYRLNTLVVEDPHWIFPGEELRLAPDEPPVADLPPVADTAQGVWRQPETPDVPPPPAAPPPPPPTESAPTVFTVRESVARSIGGREGVTYRYRPIRRGEFYAAGFLTEGQELPWAEVLGAVGKPMLGNLTASSSQRIFGEIDLRAPEGAEYRVGDSLLVARLARDVPQWGQVVRPTGIVRVTRASGRRVVAVVVEQFGRIADGQVALPLEPFRDPGVVVPVPVEDGLEGRIIAKRSRNPIAGQQDVLFIDLGRADGVVLGDIFEVVRPVGGEPREEPAWEQVGVMYIVHVRERSASGMLMSINQLGAEAGAVVRLFRKMPS